MKAIPRLKPFLILLPLWFIPALLTCQLASAGKGDEIIKKVQSKYQSLKTLSLKFSVQSQSDQDSSEEEGRIFFRHGGGFRMESAAQILICDGETLWAYNPADSQVVIFAAATGENPFLTPHQLFFEFIDEYDVMNVEEEPFQGHDCWRLTMKPQDEADPTARLLVWVDKKDYLTRRLQIEDLAQNTMTFTFEDFATGQKLPDSTFQFAPPPSVEVIDMRP